MLSASDHARKARCTGLTTDVASSGYIWSMYLIIPELPIARRLTKKSMARRTDAGSGGDRERQMGHSERVYPKRQSATAQSCQPAH